MLRIAYHNIPMGRRRYGDDDEDEKEDLNLYKGAKQRQESGPPKAVSSEKYEDQLERAEPMIQQLNNLYNQFISGAERQPPIERRKQLDQLMVGLQLASKPTPAVNFRFQTLWTQYKTNADRWDKLMLDLESGKIKRVVERK
ncbi:MAG: hypothetical protein KA715_02595 [Xanthomonadaceae bacterium]|nr:hypothetical protein [Xanthomonadaceae bacterium]